MAERTTAVFVVMDQTCVVHGVYETCEEARDRETGHPEWCVWKYRRAADGYAWSGHGEVADGRRPDLRLSGMGDYRDGCPSRS